MKNFKIRSADPTRQNPAKSGPDPRVHPTRGQLWSGMWMRLCLVEKAWESLFYWHVLPLISYSHLFKFKIIIIIFIIILFSLVLSSSSSSQHHRRCHHPHLNLHFLPKSIKCIDLYFPTVQGKQPLVTLQFWDSSFSHSDASILRKSCLVTIRYNDNILADLVRHGSRRWSGLGIWGIGVWTIGCPPV